ncbi:MAG: hypothetical protein K5755_00935 [Clostridiales bacterium]|nr:hypothetical protein [Clostridia bacterium]MCR4563188.1 hypothetical protein [Clostridiales bacterium]
MNKRIIAVICVMLALTFVFVGCTRKKYYTDPSGKKHVAYTDENGETVTDSAGRAIIIPTDSRGDLITDKFGDYKTEVVPDDSIVIDANGKNVETGSYTLKVPEGWVLNRDALDYVQLKYGTVDSKITVDIHTSRNSYEDAVNELESIHNNFVDNVEEVKKNEKKEITLRNGEISPVTLFSFIGTNTLEDGSKGTACYNFYVFNVKGYTFSVICGALDEKDMNNTDFNVVLDAINFK